MNYFSKDYPLSILSVSMTRCIYKVVENTWTCVKISSKLTILINNHELDSINVNKVFSNLQIIKVF